MYMRQIFESENISFTEVSEQLIGDYLTMVNDIENVDRFIGGHHAPYSYEQEVEWVGKKLENGDPCFVVKTPYGFSGEQTKLVAVFTFPDTSPVTVVKTITVTKE